MMTIKTNNIPKPRSDTKTNIRPFGIYIHWPYCKSKCPYCDFFSSVKKNIEQEKIISDYIEELKFYHQYTTDEKVSSIFFGGGTPSLIKPALIEKLITEITKLWKVKTDVEISLEANPNTDDGTLFLNLKTAGINRLSLGVQALNDTELKFLGRTHNLHQALTSVGHVLNTFDNHSMDLIYARPHQQAKDWQKELEQATSFGFKHLSLYQLTIEEGTVFAKKGITPLEEEQAVIMYEDTVSYLKSKGYPRYEVSNFATKEYECKHNKIYWQGDNYLGIGMGAHGRIQTTNKKIYATTHRCQLEELSPKERAEELLFMGLRLKEGINKTLYLNRCGIELEQYINTTAKQEMINLKLLKETNSHLRLTPQGFLVMNKVIEELIPQD